MRSPRVSRGFAYSGQALDDNPSTPPRQSLPRVSEAHRGAQGRRCFSAPRSHEGQEDIEDGRRDTLCGVFSW